MAAFRGITVDEYKSTCMTFQLLYAFHQTPFGKCLVAVTDTDGEVAYLTFVDEDEEEAVRDLQAKWSLTQISKDTGDKTVSVVRRIFDYDSQRLHSVRVLMKGTEFQIKVWRSLMEIPMGTVVTYEDVARMVNCRAPIAVGSAISKNYVACVVPCHRVVAKNVCAATDTRVPGTKFALHKYAWGIKRKIDILTYEKQ